MIGHTFDFHTLPERQAAMRQRMLVARLGRQQSRRRRILSAGAAGEIRALRAKGWSYRDLQRLYCIALPTLKAVLK